MRTTLARIDDAFRAAGIWRDDIHDPRVAGQRRSQVEQYYHSLNWSDRRDVARFLRVVERVQFELEVLSLEPNAGAYAERSIATLQRLLDRNGVLEREGKLVPPNKVESGADLLAVIKHRDAPELAEQILRIQNSVEEDPGLAIGTAKELVEAACKIILEERGVALNPLWDLTQLAKNAREVLRLLPEDVPERTKGLDSVKRLLGQLGVVAQSMSEIRNLYGTGHGKGRKHSTLSPRHARLAVGAATTLATFLLETHWERE